MKKNYKLLATLVLSGLAGAAFGVLPAEAAVTVRSADGTETSLTKTEFTSTSLHGNTYTNSTSGNTVTLSNSTAQSSDISGGYMKYDGDTSAEADAGVNHNTVTLTNTSASGTRVYGGYMEYYGDTSAEADAVAGVNHNTVTLTNTSASGTRVYGGYVAAAPPIPTVLNVSSNTMEISNTAEKKCGVSTEKSTKTDTSTEADPISTSSNSVTITGSQVEGVYGGVGQIGSAKGNIVTITDSSVEMEAVGGETGYMMNWITQPGQLKDAENNQVIVNGSSTIGTVVGGEAANLPATPSPSMTAL